MEDLARRTGGAIRLGRVLLHKTRIEGTDKRPDGRFDCHSVVDALTGAGWLYRLTAWAAPPRLTD
eukprot:1182912-Prorocentrum_minimum.AAC.2